MAAERSAKTTAERRGISVEEVWRERAAIYPQNRVLEPREVAQVVAFLCSDAPGGVNGEAVTVALGGVWQASATFWQVAAALQIGAACPGRRVGSAAS